MTTTAGQEHAAKQEPRQKTQPWIILSILGAVAVIVSFIIGAQKYQGDASGHWTLSRANGMCQSSAGAFAQMMNSQAGAQCAKIASLEQWRGWLMIIGLLAIAAGIVLNIVQPGKTR
jgi:hypothetical protein